MKIRYDITIEKTSEMTLGVQNDHDECNPRIKAKDFTLSNLANNNYNKSFAIAFNFAHAI